MEKWIGLYGALIGSLATIVINKLYDYFHLKRIHRMEISKKTFERKLQVFENAVAIYNSSLASLQQILILLKLEAEHSNFSSEHVALLIEKYSKQFEDITQNALHAAAALKLYIDLEDDNTDLIKDYFNALGELDAILNVKIINIDEYRLKIAELERVTQLIKDDVKKSIALLRLDIKKYN